MITAGTLFVTERWAPGDKPVSSTIEQKAPKGAETTELFSNENEHSVHD